MGNPGNHAELEIEKLELRDADAALRQDLGTIERTWSDKLVVSGAGNLLFSKAQVLAFFRAGLVRLKSFERRVTRVVIDGDTAITTGSDTVEPLVGADAGKTVFCSYMNCWIRDERRVEAAGPSGQRRRQDETRRHLRSTRYLISSRQHRLDGIGIADEGNRRGKYGYPTGEVKSSPPTAPTFSKARTGQMGVGFRFVRRCAKSSDRRKESRFDSRGAFHRPSMLR